MKSLIVRGSCGLPVLQCSGQRCGAGRAASPPAPAARRERRSTPHQVDCGPHGDGTPFTWIAFLMIAESGGHCVAGSDPVPRANFDARRSGGPSRRVRKAGTRDCLSARNRQRAIPEPAERSSVAAATRPVLDDALAGDRQRVARRRRPAVVVLAGGWTFDDHDPEPAYAPCGRTFTRWVSSIDRRIESLFVWYATRTAARWV